MSEDKDSGHERLALASKQLSELKEIASGLGIAAEEIEASCKDDTNDALIQLIEKRAASLDQTTKPKRNKGNKERRQPPQHVIERREERKKMIEEASVRSSWTSLDEDRWDTRHQIMYSNANLHPNYRSYFDRRVLRREELEELGIDHPGSVKPSWRLHTEGLSPEERKAQDDVLQSTGACAKPHLGDTVTLPHPSTFTTPGSIHDPTLASQSASVLPSHLKAIGPRQPSNNPFVWSNRHNIVWCNERNTGGKKLNPVQLRCYFDRMRLPHNCRCEVPVKNVRMLPNWRLRQDPVTGKDLGSSIDSLSEPSHEQRAQQSRFEKCEKTWNSRHELVFKNEEVSRLDRCYFDRWREPDANKDAKAKNEVQSLKPTWSLEKEGSPERVAKELLRNTAARHAPSGHWNPRHERHFVNNIHTNLKSYFDRGREPEEMSGTKKKQKYKDTAARLGVDWNLQDFGSIDYTSTLRSNSVPELPRDRTQKRNGKPSWFSSHGVTFLSSAEHSQMKAEDGKKQRPPAKPPLPDCFKTAS